MGRAGSRSRRRSTRAASCHASGKWRALRCSQLGSLAVSMLRYWACDRAIAVFSLGERENNDPPMVLSYLSPRRTESPPGFFEMCAGFLQADVYAVYRLLASFAVQRRKFFEKPRNLSAVKGLLYDARGRILDYVS